MQILARRKQLLYLIRIVATGVTYGAYPTTVLSQYLYVTAAVFLPYLG